MDLLRFAWKELKRRKLRTLINIIGYALSVAVMIILVSAITYTKHNTDKILAQTGTHFVSSVPASLPPCPQCSLKFPENKDEGFVVYGVPTKLISIKFIDEVKNIPAVKDASPCLLYRFKNDKGEVSTIAGFDVTNNIAVATTTCANTDVISGRFLLPNDKGKVMIEESFAKLKGYVVGDKVSIGKDSFLVIGVVNAGIRPVKSDIYMGFDEAVKLINKRMGNSPIHNEANIILVETKSSKLHEEAINSMKKLLPSLVFSSYACYKPASTVMGINENTVYLLLVIIGISTILFSLRSQLSSVIERRKDIGILKAIGWTDGDIVAQIFIESVIQSLIGGLIGCLISAIALIVIPTRILIRSVEASHIPISPVIIIIGLSLAIFGGIVAGIFPAFVSAKQRPADALRSI